MPYSQGPEGSTGRRDEPCRGSGSDSESPFRGSGYGGFPRVRGTFSRLYIGVMWGYIEHEFRICGFPN